MESDSDGAAWRNPHAAGLVNADLEPTRAACYARSPRSTEHDADHACLRHGASKRSGTARLSPTARRRPDGLLIFLGSSGRTDVDRRGGDHRRGLYWNPRYHMATQAAG